MKKFVAAKNSISELFIYLSKVKDIMDESLYDAICVFQKLVFANVKAGLLGRSSCSNKNIVTDSLSAIILDLSERINELDKYLTKFSV